MNLNSRMPFRAIMQLLMLLSISALIAACSASLTFDIEANGESSGELRTTPPETVGIDSDRLESITAAMQGLVDEGLLAGVVTMASRDNRVVHFESVGYRDLESRAPMTNDTLFRIYSMTKPVTGVALMILYEEGKFNLSDPVEQYIPELKDLRVYAGTDSSGNMLTEEADHPMTIRELMSHTGGLTYGIFAQSPVDSAYLASRLGAAAAAGVLEPGETSQDFVRKLGQIPLKYQPGTRWEYSVSVDVQGYLVEVLSGQSFGSFLQERLFDPLGMIDTHFYVPPDKLDRFAQVYAYNDSGELTPSELFPGTDYTTYPDFEAGGSGLVSTASDYMRFSQMLLNGGELNGTRILSPLTVSLMNRDQSPVGVDISVFGRGGTSFGLDFAVVTDPVEAESYSKGEYSWGGAAGTWFWIDPVEKIIFIGMIQVSGAFTPDVRGISHRLLYQSIMEPYGI